MAEIAPDSSLADVISSLDLASVPEKLHCSTCHGFLLNAYRTSCCEQNICEKCFNEITDLCPMCKHKPFSKDLCRPAKAMRTTVKAYLRNIEKTLIDERTKSQATQSPVIEAGLSEMPNSTIVHAIVDQRIENAAANTGSHQLEEQEGDSTNLDMKLHPSVEDQPKTDCLEDQSMVVKEEDTAAERQGSVESDPNDDEIEIQVEPSAEDEELHIPQAYETEEQDQSYDNNKMDNSQNSDVGMHDMSSGMDMNGYNMQNMNMMGFNGMGLDMGIMQQMMNGNMNPMMPMGMTSMFGGFGGANGMLNGMNMMGMNFNPNQMFDGWNGQNSNMWQNNNAMNGMGGDFGSPYGSNASQQGKFYSQQFSNIDYNGYNPRFSRGRGRGGRGFYGRGRGSFNQYNQGPIYQNGNEHQQNESQAAPIQVTHNSGKADEGDREHISQAEDEVPDQDDFAPGGQDEVQEALGTDRDDEDKIADEPRQVHNSDRTKEGRVNSSREKSPELVAVPQRPAHEAIIPEAYHEDFDTMAPPSAPTGPSGRYSDKDFAFRARGHGKYPPRARVSISTSTGYPASPVRSISQTSLTAPSPPAKGVGVAGAPTGPRAMREPPVPKTPLSSSSNGGGFQIIGRASLQSSTNRPKDDDLSRSVSPPDDYAEYHDDRVTRYPSKFEKYDNAKNDAESVSNHDYDRNSRETDRKSRHYKKADHRDDHVMEDFDQGYESSNHKSSRRNSRYDRERSRKEEKHSASAKHRSSRRYYDDDFGSDYDRNDHEDSTIDKHRSARNGKSSQKYETHRERDKDSHRDRKRDRDRDRDRDRERERDEDRPKEKEDKYRKRSRHDRDREDDFVDPDDDESRHRSRRHKKEHHASGRKDREKETEDADLGLRISGRSTSNRQSTLPTPSSATSSAHPASFVESEKDPHTLEREARNRERMLKEQQRREKAALDKRNSGAGGKGSKITTNSGRRVSYKYEDEVERGMGAADEREKARWR